MSVSMMVKNIPRRPVPQNKPIMGRGLFDVETGIDADLHRWLSGASLDIIMQAFNPSLVGQDPVQPVLGKNSGAAAVEYYLDKHGLSATREEVKEIADRVKWQGRIQHALLSDAQFLSICANVIRKEMMECGWVRLLFRDVGPLSACHRGDWRNDSQIC